MYDNPVCKSGAFCVVIGSLAISGIWLGVVVVAVIAAVALGIRFAFRKGKGSNQA